MLPTSLHYVDNCVLEVSVKSTFLLRLQHVVILLLLSAMYNLLIAYV